ncbi:MAG: flagellar biosynthesis protein FlhF [Nitrospirae bacterium]|nr:flagellar biosynthesis protein FlhF [Nitrospirota bacterium]
MKIKKFQARTFAEALSMVKKELSEDAIILSTEELKGANPCVEVTAAVDYDSPKAGTYDTRAVRLKNDLNILEKIRSFSKEGTSHSAKASKDDKKGAKDKTQQRHEAVPDVAESVVNKAAPVVERAEKTLVANTKPAVHKPVETNPEPVNHITEPAFTRRELEHFLNKMTVKVQSEIEYLRDSIEDMKNLGFEMSLPPKKRMLLYYLKDRAIREEYAVLLCEKANDVQDLPSLLMSNIKIKDKHTDRKAIMLIGPTGVGKTTTIAKLAANSIREGKRTAIINLDTYRIGAVEQVRIYARIMGIPLAVASTPAELKNTLLRFADTKDIIYIDTTGRSPMDEAYMDDMAEICLSDLPIEVHLLMSANSDDEFMTEAYRYYRRLPINYLGYTKVDEAVRYGSVYNMALTYQKPIAYITTGQKVPDDIEFAGMERIADLVLKKEFYKC